MLKQFYSFSLLISAVYSKSADQSPTGALIRFPYVNAHSALHGVAWEVSPSKFGYHNYGGSLDGYLVLPVNTSYHWECTQEPKNANPYIHYVDDWTANKDAKYIFLIDRGSCYFVDKVENAQALGAAAVIVMDSRREGLFTMWPPEDWVDDITIPSVLLSYANASLLMQQLGVQNWNPNSVTNTKYPSATAMNWTIVRLEWGLPHPDDRVEYEIWTSANDADSVAFKKNWRNTALNLDYNNYTLFTPHVYILNGTHWQCDDGSFRCYTQCTNSGRYCAVDPDYNITAGVTGMAVVQENLRSTCVWKYIQSSTKLNQSLWWDYSNLWNKNCYMTSNMETTFTESCSYKQMNTLDSKMSSWVKNCITSSGGYNYTGGVNSILDDETRIREKNYVYTFPTILVNAATVFGNIDCAQITEQTCQVLDAICAGYLNGTAPPQCSQTTPPPVVNCTQSEKDCRGVCFGQYLTDRCGQCLSSENSAQWDSCVGCDGVPNSGKKVNICGYCLSTSDSDFSTYGMDCNQNCNGGFVVDSCGNCLSPSSEEYNSCKYSTGSSDSKASTSLTLVIILSVIGFLLLVLCGAVLYKLWQRQQFNDQRFSTIVKQYQLMDSTGNLKSTKGAQPIPSDEPDE
jgi:hypothetical protein